MNQIGWSRIRVVFGAAGLAALGLSQAIEPAVASEWSSRQQRAPLAELTLDNRVAQQPSSATDLETEILSLSTKGFTAYGNGDYPQALEWFQQALTLNQRLGNPEIQLNLTQTISFIYFQLSEYPQAITALEQVLSLARELGNAELEQQALTGLGSNYYWLGNYDRALEYHQPALQLAQELENAAAISEALLNIGLVYYLQVNYPEAIAYFEQTLDSLQPLATAAANSSEPNYAAVQYGQTLGLLASVQFLEQDFLAAIATNQHALEFAQTQADRDGVWQALLNLGLNHYWLNDYDQAIAYYQQALALSDAADNDAERTNLFGQLSDVYYYLGDTPQAVAYAEQSLELAIALDQPGQQALLYNKLAGYYGQVGQHQAAKVAFEDALRLIEGLPGEHRNTQANALAGLASYDMIEGQHAAAAQKYEQALAIYREINNRYNEGTILDSIGAIYQSLGDYEQALTYHEARLAISLELEELYGEGESRTQIGLVQFKLGRLAEAEQQLRQAMQAFESIRGKVDKQLAGGELAAQQDAFNVSLFDIQTGIYQLLQRTLVAQDQPLEALELAERGRARAFVDLLAARLQTVQADQDTESTHPQAAEAINVEAIDVAAMQQVAAQHDATLVQYSFVPSLVESESELLYIWVIKPTGEVHFESVDLADQALPHLVRRLSTNNLVRAMRCFGNRGCWQAPVAAGKQEPQVEPAQVLVASRGAATYALATSEQRLVEPFSERDSKGDQRQSDRFAQALYTLLITPIAQYLPTDPDEHVIFIPQGALFSLPFPALQDERGQYLIEQHTILTAPSIQVLDLTYQRDRQLEAMSLPDTQALIVGRDRQAAEHALILGNPVMPAPPPPDDQTAQLLPLPNAETEAEAIAQLLIGDTANAEQIDALALTGAEATKSKVVQQMQTARLIHLATHGKADDQQGMDSWIALAPDATGGTAPGNFPGILQAREIAQMDLVADLVVLSACETGQGKLTGDGVIGLSRSFLTAGAPSVIVSLWTVPDAATADLMIDFYEQLSTSPDKAQALRQAMLNAIAAGQPPLDWAAFTLIGEAL